MATRLHTAIVGALIVLIGFSASSRTERLPALQHHFAISLSPGANTALFTAAVVSESGGKIVRSRPVAARNFMLQISGNEYSLANPDGINLIKEKGIESCEVWLDSLSRQYRYNCNPVKNIWRLRYDSYPVLNDAMNDKVGWSNKKYTPSDGQMAILGGYGLKSVNGFIYGDNLFRLFKDMNNPSWVATYKGS